MLEYTKQRTMEMKELKWFLFGALTAGIGFWIYKSHKKSSQTDLYVDGFSEGYLNTFSVTHSPISPKQYGQIAQEIRQKQIQAHRRLNTEHTEQRLKLKFQ